MFERVIARRPTAGCGALLLAAALAACGAGDGRAQFPGLSAELNAQLGEVRRAIEPFRDVAAAREAGYTVLVTHPTSGARCLDHPELGAMGMHYLNPELVDDAVTASSPEVLIYEPQADGSLELVGVEYVVPFDVRGERESAPILFGREFRHNYTFELWALHAWVGDANPSGAFAEYNPARSCEHADAVE